MKKITEINDTWSFSQFNKKTSKYEIVKLNYTLQFINGKLTRVFTTQLLPVILKKGNEPLGFPTEISKNSEIFQYFKNKHNSEKDQELIYPISSQL